MGNVISRHIITTVTQPTCIPYQQANHLVNTTATAGTLEYIGNGFVINQTIRLIV
jgi:hypothetical protein